MNPRHELGRLTLNIQVLDLQPLSRLDHGRNITFINNVQQLLNMSTEEIIKKTLKKIKKKFPGMKVERLEKELIPLKPGEELQPRVAKKKKKD